MSDYLCEELIVEIFTRLPPKSLLRFRSLSKSLCSCISSPSFIRMHTFRSPQKILFEHPNIDTKNNEAGDIYTLLREDELPQCLCPKRGYIGITTVPFPKNFGIIGSCNGIFCLLTRKGFIIWNSSIRRKLSVPECPQSYEQYLQSGIGFGFDSISDDYKIVSVSCAKDSSFVYGMKTGVWCEIASSKSESTYVSHQGHLFNGVLHWKVCHKDIELQDIYRYSYILTFDLSTHVFGMIPLPAFTLRFSLRMITTGLTTIQGSLALISSSYYLEDSWIMVWRDASWSVVFKLNIGDSLIVTRALQLQGQLTNNGDLLLNIRTKGLHVFNPKTGVRSRIVKFNPTSSLEDFHQCVETLNLLDVGEAAC